MLACDPPQFALGPSGEYQIQPCQSAPPPSESDDEGLGRQRMWLIPRRTNGLGPHSIPLPQPVRDALVRWYAGKGSRHDEEAGIMLVQQARIGEKWIACDCLQQIGRASCRERVCQYV